MDKRYSRFDDFWDHYLREHAAPQTRQMHFMATTASLSIAASGLLVGRYILLLLAVIVGYGIAWLSHFVVERNKPLTWEYPWFSLLAEFKLFFLMAAGRIDEDVARALSRPPL